MTEVLNERKVLLHFTPELVAKMHNGTFTIENPSTGDHRTYRLRIPSDGVLKGRQIIQLMIGPDNENSFKGFGFVNHAPEGIRLRVWSKLRGTEYDRHAKILEDLFNHGDESIYVKKFNLKVMTSGKCYICGRKLTTPDSIEAGIGPICAGRSE